MTQEAGSDKMMPLWEEQPVGPEVSDSGYAGCPRGFLHRPLPGS